MKEPILCVVAIYVLLTFLSAMGVSMSYGNSKTYEECVDVEIESRLGYVMYYVAYPMRVSSCWLGTLPEKKGEE